MPRYRIEHRYPCYPSGGCIPYDGYFVQVLQEGFFFDKWVDVKGFTSRKKAEELLDMLK
jgi:hypothetical protein